MINKIKGYFDTNANDPLTIGVYPMGTGLDIERPYRHYWELKQFISYLPKINELTLLELGCGAGRWGISLSPKIKKYFGIDISQSQIELAKNVAAERNLFNVDFREGDLSQLSLANIKTDIVYASGVFQYIEDSEIDTILQQAKYLLPYDGLFIDRSTFIVGNSRIVRNDPHYFCIYRTKEELIAIFKKNGFELIVNDRSYVYLRNKDLFKHGWVAYLVQWGIKYIPVSTFYIMRLISSISEKAKNTIYIHENIGIFSHEFTVFRLKNE